jgi:hypothetical protein
MSDPTFLDPEHVPPPRRGKNSKTRPEYDRLAAGEIGFFPLNGERPPTVYQRLKSVANSRGFQMTAYRGTFEDRDGFVVRFLERQAQP